MSDSILSAVLSATWFLVQLIGTLVLIGAASGAAVAGFLNMRDEVAEHGLVQERRS